MKKILIVFFCFFCLFAVAQFPALKVNYSNSSKLASVAPDSNKELRKIDHNAFKAGEKLEWVVRYGYIEAGTASIELIEEDTKILGRKVLHAIGIGETKGAFDWFFKVRDRYETYFDAEGVFPWLFVRRVDEGGYLINQDYRFHQNKNMVDNGKGKTFETPDYVQDMISAVYFARTLDLSNTKPGDVITMPAFVDNKVWPAKVRFIGKETIKTKTGKYKCLKFNPVIQQGRIFKDESDMTVYITDDENKIPILVEAKIMVGSVKMELISYEGLANPLAKVK
ncbi:MAG: DUF3108 domain-containing protein [Bacteroidetes bacterium]|nr:DUF3108 domain-containing protein [Bacteroidota bacterium]